MREILNRRTMAYIKALIPLALLMVTAPLSAEGECPQNGVVFYGEPDFVCSQTDPGFIQMIETREITNIPPDLGISSFKIPSGSVLVSDHPDLGGMHICVEGDDPDLSDNFVTDPKGGVIILNDNIRSAEAFIEPGCPQIKIFLPIVIREN